jgi:signal transduction histidine kinase
MVGRARARARTGTATRTGLASAIDWPNNPGHVSDPGPLPFEAEPGSGFTLQRLGWLIRLRWAALLGVVVAAALAASGAFPGVNWPVLALTASAVACYNLLLWLRHRRGEGPTGERAAIAQQLTDFLFLTLALWAAGGIRSPFIGLYIFHVALAGILSGPRAVLVSACLALGCGGLLALFDVSPGMHIGSWNPNGLWAPVADAAAFAITVGGTAYLVTHAVTELRERERALRRARHRAELDFELLSNTLNQLDAGLEVLDAQRRVVWQNRRARDLLEPSGESEPRRCPGASRPCERDVTGRCPIERALEAEQPGRCRFAVSRDGSERVYELLAFPLSAERAGSERVMNLYLDRTHETLAERQLVLAERLASLGRIAQSVAHELNTPLATIRTLATDMTEVISQLDAGEPARRSELVRDIGESATLIREETGRLGRITHALLAGGDLVRARVTPAVPLAAVAERAVALVFAGARQSGRVQVDASLDGLDVTADRDRLVQVLVNLLQNAHDAVRGLEHGRVRVSAERSEHEIAIVVDDDGTGLDPVVRAHLFEPFTTTKPPGEGTGLGLYTSYMLVRAMHGSLDLQPRPGGGTRAVVKLPTVEPAEPAATGAVA